jgi:hypothetical protein
MAFFIQSYLMSDFNPLVINIQGGSNIPGTLLDASPREPALFSVPLLLVTLIAPWRRSLRHDGVFCAENSSEISFF